MQHLELYRPNAVFSWLNFTLAHNTGAAFSFLAGGSGWQRWFLSVVAVIIVGVLLVWLWRLPHRARLLPSALALVIGGAIGNVVDRIRFGYVVDFIDVHYAGWHWPAFNWPTRPSWQASSSCSSTASSPAAGKHGVTSPTYEIRAVA